MNLNFNLHVDIINDKRATDFINTLDDFGFTQHVYGPTHNRGHTLDLVFSKGLNAQISSVRDVALSDHYFIEFFMSVPMPQVNAQRTT